MFTAQQTSEIRNIIRSTFIDDPSDIISLIQDWITDKTLEELGLLDVIFPVGRCVVQFPDADDNDPDVAFPASKAPAALYGGTWEAQWDDEGICFYTGAKTGDTEQTRTNGLQEDQFQAWQIGAEYDTTGARNTYMRANARDYQEPATGGNPNFVSVLTNTGYQGGNNIIKAMNDGTNGTPRIGSTTKGRNRLIRVWKRTA